jgi:hypothetical protein
MKRSILALVCAALPVLAGCAEVNVVTEVKADGSWARKLEFKMGSESPMGEKGDFSKTFDLPKGEGWTVKEGTEAKNMLYTAERAGKKEDPLPADVAVKSKKGKVILVNEASLREVAPGRFEYRETFRWKGDKPKDYLKPDPKEIGVVKTVLPEGLADDAKALEVLQAAQRSMYRRLLGPNDPQVGQLMMHPRLGVRRLKRDLVQALAVTLKDMFGGKLTDAQRGEAARKIVDLLEIENVKDKAEPKPPGGGGEGGEEGSKDEEPDFVPLSFTLKVPGKIVSANGDIDAPTGEVFWAFYAQSAQLEDVVLTATFELE